VHGHWTIDVRNPDGALVSHNEFENELTAFMRTGTSVLAATLGRRATVGQWMIRLAGGVGVGDQVGPCTVTRLTNNIPDTIPAACDIVEPTSPNVDGATQVFKTLALTVPTANVFGVFETGTVELSGSVTASSTTQIGHVMTFIGLCDTNTLPAACAPAVGAGDIRMFTGKYLDAPVVGQIGQIIQVKVVLSFS
jgi:hypothetical protein